MKPPLLQAKRLRIAMDGTPATGELNFQSRGDFVCLIDASPLMTTLLAALSDSASPAPEPQVLAGELLLVGERHEQAARIAGLVAAHGARPAKLTVAEYLQWNAQLAGLARTQAKLKIETMLNSLRLDRWVQRQLGNLSRVEFRVLALVAACVTDRSPLVVDAAFRDLDTNEADFLAAVLHRLRKHRATLLAMPILPTQAAARALVQQASDVLIFRGGALLVQARGSELEGALGLFEVQLLSPNQQLQTALEEAGATVSGTATRLLVRLPSRLRAADLLRVAEEQQAIVTALVPLVA
jgi:ABC-type multidrug transport system ATPase subunit